MKRGDVVTAVFPGDYGKPRPAVVMQTDLAVGLESVFVAPLTSHIVGAATVRVLVEPSPVNGLQARSEVMVDKTAAVSRHRLGGVIGRLEPAALQEVEGRLAFLLGLAG